MSDVPQDIFAAAGKACDLCGITVHSEMRMFSQHAASLAIMEERERCAKIAGKEADTRFDNENEYPAARVHDFIVAARKIEKAIRGTS